MTRDEMARHRAEWDRRDAEKTDQSPVAMCPARQGADCGCGLGDKCPDPPHVAEARLEASVQEFLSDWRKGDFDLPPLAALDAEAMERAITENRINHLYAEKRVFVPDLLVALIDLKRAFGDPVTRRALGGHNEAQQSAILNASAIIARAGK